MAIFNAWLPFLNLVLLAINVIGLAVLMPHSLTKLDESMEAERAGAQLGMDLLCVKRPSAVFVDREFPRKDAFAMFDSSQRLLISAGDSERERGGRQAMRKATVALDVDFEMECYYSISKDIHVHELELTLKDETLFDLNADGRYDVRISSRGPKSSKQLWYQGQWRDIGAGGDGDRFHKRLLDGTEVKFDQQKGLWLAPGEQDADGGHHSL